MADLAQVLGGGEGGTPGCSYAAKSLGWMWRQLLPPCSPALPRGGRSPAPALAFVGLLVAAAQRFVRRRRTTAMLWFSASVDEVVVALLLCGK